MSCPPEHTRQHWWGEAVEIAYKQDLLSKTGDAGRDAARLASQKGGLGAAWMQVSAFDEGPSRISPDEYRLALRWHLGLPILPQDQEGATCPACGDPADTLGDHLLCCRRNNFYTRHFAVQETFISMAQAGDLSFGREVSLTKSCANEAAGSLQPAIRPADLLLKAWQGGKDVAVDFTIVHALQQNQKPWSKQKANAFLKSTEARKITKYHDACEKEGWLFMPSAFDTWGGMGPKAKEVLFKMLGRAVGGVPAELKALKKCEHRQHLSLALMRQIWRLLAAKNNFH